MLMSQNLRSTNPGPGRNNTETSTALSIPASRQGIRGPRMVEGWPLEVGRGLAEKLLGAHACPLPALQESPNVQMMGNNSCAKRRD